MNKKSGFKLLIEGELSLLGFWFLYWVGIVVGVLFWVVWVGVESGWSDNILVDLGLAIFLGAFFSAIGGFVYWGLRILYGGWLRSRWAAYVMPILSVELLLLGVYYYSVGENFFWSYVIFLHTAPIFWLLYYWPCLLVLVVGLWLEGRGGNRRVEVGAADILDDWGEG